MFYLSTYALHPVLTSVGQMLLIPALQRYRFAIYTHAVRHEARLTGLLASHWPVGTLLSFGRRGGFHRRENVEKQCKTVQNSDVGAKTTVTALKIQIFEFKI